MPKKTTATLPVVGDCYTCTMCGMKLEIMADCACDDPTCVTFSCCGQPMTKDA